MRNLILLTLARSGSTMVTLIFKAHGLKSPEGERSVGYRGTSYMNHEPTSLKGAINASCIDRSDPGKFHVFGCLDTVEGHINSLEKPYVIKTGVHKLPALKSADAVVAKIIRNTESVIKSQAEKSGIPVSEIAKGVAANLSLMDEVDGFIIRSDEVVAGNFSSLEPVFDAIGCDFDPKLAKPVINPSMWHY